MIEQPKVDEAIRKFAGTYSDAAELDETGTLRWTRDIQKGEAVTIPVHLLSHAKPGPDDAKQG